MAGLKATDADERLGQRLRAAREAAGVTQRALAGAIGVSAAQLQKYERGINAVSAVSLCKAARFIGVAVTDLLDPLDREPEPIFDRSRALARAIVSTIQRFERQGCSLGEAA